MSTEPPAPDPSTPPSTPTSDVPALPTQRRTLTTLAATQVLSGVGVASGIAVAPLVASALSGSDAIAGLTSTSGVVGAALVALPLAHVAGQRGRRPSLLLGFGVATGGAVLATVAVLVGSWPLLVVAMLFFGSGTAAGLASRFAATDLATPQRRARDLSVVVWATTVGSVVGPTLAGVADRVAGPGLRLGGDGHAQHGATAPSAAPFVLAAVAFALAAAVVVVWLRPDPLLASRAMADSVPDAVPDVVSDAGPGAVPGAASGAAPGAGPGDGKGSSWRDGLRAGWAVVSASPTARLALGAIVLSHLVMVGLMSMTPVHMNHGGATLQVVGLVISAHIAGMYALSPVVGWLADRVGHARVLYVGGALLLAAAVVVAGAPGEDSARLTVGLVLLGLGWSCGLVAGSALLVDATPGPSRTSVQGLSDLAMNTGGAVGGILAGAIIGFSSYGALAWGAAALVVVCAVVAAPLARRATLR
ncbi:MFS family permease [Cellulosimicrobium cellulans]|uniref:MFS transporter n=1 Tax=Cellulosimicrobium cellulans TaxID=1710 RepID=UPI00195E474A|nr:MFS transporter [Cellulosimicrobium cellulans]MBM7818581.1 MFS family permease [Cellulosimicrobium cellulans]